MIVRIVKMSFEPTQVANFLKVFNQSCVEIRNFPGCSKLELYRDNQNKNILFTYSYWETDEDLQAYRKSELFAKTWSRTKVLFNAKPEAWSLGTLHQA